MKLYDAIKSDNLVLFSANIDANDNLSFGRFPLLSLIYLFGAKKVAKKFEYKLAGKKNFVEVDEPYEIFKILKKVAGKKIRACNKNLFYPPEMLALMGNDRKLKKLYYDFYTNEEIKNQIITIYKIVAQSVYFDNLGIHISKRVVGLREKKLYKLSLVYTMTFAFVIVIIYVVMGVSFGFGVGDSPYKIWNESQLLSALQGSGKYVLAKDITLSQNTDIQKFEGVFDGGGHTIYLDDISSNAIFAKNQGTIRNLKIVYSDIVAEFSGQVSLLVNQNEGTIDGVEIMLENARVGVKKNAEDNGLYGVSINNYGEIRNVDIKLGVNLDATLDGECSLAGIACMNFGKVENCNILSGSYLTASECDVAGAVVTNGYGGVVNGIKNYANITQESIKNSWSPNVAGIVVQNYGKVQASINFGTLNNFSNCDNENGEELVLIGGISANNYGLIDKCLNKGDINATSKKLMVYAGGVSGYGIYNSISSDNTIVTSTISNSGATGNISVVTEGKKAYVFAGGISGYLYGEMVNCFSLSSFEMGIEEEGNKKYFIGNSVGATYVQFSIIYLIATNNFILDRANVNAHIGAIISNGSIVGINQDYNVSSVQNGITTLGTESAVKEREVYFDEQDI